MEEGRYLTMSQQGVPDPPPCQLRASKLLQSASWPTPRWSILGTPGTRPRGLRPGGGVKLVNVMSGQEFRWRPTASRVRWHRAGDGFLVRPSGAGPGRLQSSPTVRCHQPAGGFAVVTSRQALRQISHGGGEGAKAVKRREITCRAPKLRPGAPATQAAGQVAEPQAPGGCARKRTNRAKEWGSPWKQKQIGGLDQNSSVPLYTNLPTSQGKTSPANERSVVIPSGPSLIKEFGVSRARCARPSATWPSRTCSTPRGWAPSSPVARSTRAS